MTLGGCSGEAMQALFGFLTAAACEITIAVLSPSRVRLLATDLPQQAGLAAAGRSFPKFMFTASVMPPSHLISIVSK